MIKKTLCIIIALLTLMSVLSVGALSASAEEVIATNNEATKDEATVDEAELKISDQPKAPENSVDGTVIGYIGDTNTDGKINVKDATAVQKHLAKLISLGERAKLLGDADNNQKLNVRDATTIQKYIAGIEVKSYIWHLLYETGTHKHNYVETVFEVTCEKDGYTGYSCICGDEYKENIVKATGHSYVSKMFYATCVDSAYRLYTCQTCNYEYKEHLAGPTGDHEFVKGVCKQCGYRSNTPHIQSLNDYVIENGVHEQEFNAYCYYLETGNNFDVAALVCTEEDDSVALTYAVYFEDSVDVVTIAISPQDDKFYFYMICGGYFECAGSYYIGQYTENVVNVLDSEYYFYVDGIAESDALAYTLDYVDAALNIYKKNASDLPVSLGRLGFGNY